MQLVEAFTILSDFLAQTYRSGCLFFVTDLEKYTFVYSNGFSATEIKTGTPVQNNSIIGRCLRDGQPINAVDDSDTIGKANFFVQPVTEDGEIKGCFGIITKRVHNFIQAFPDLAEPLANAFPEGANLAVTDLEKIIYNQGSKKFDIGSKNGDLLGKGGKAEECINTGRTISVDLRKDNKMTRAIYIPLFDEDKTVIGVFLLFLARTLPETLKEMASHLSSSSQEISSVVETVAVSACDISTNEQHLYDKIKEMALSIEEIRGILDSIKGIADQTKMLGLNATIEAARAGEHGRGFGVVAEEIRKLSDQSKETADLIRKITVDISHKIEDVHRITEESLRQSQEQAAATEQISASIMEMTGMSERLTKTAQEL